MNSKPRLEDKFLSDAFGPFEKATRKAFAFLRKPPYEFKQGQTFYYRPEAIVRYENETTAVIVSYEWGGTPSVILARLDPSGSSVDEEQFGLKFLAMERCPEELGVLETSSTDDDLAQVLIRYADILRKCGDEVLTGNFQFLPRLRKLITAERRKANLQVPTTEPAKDLQVD